MGDAFYSFIVDACLLQSEPRLQTSKYISRTQTHKVISFLKQTFKETNGQPSARRSEIIHTCNVAVKNVLSKIFHNNLHIYIYMLLDS